MSQESFEARLQRLNVKADPQPEATPTPRASSRRFVWPLALCGALVLAGGALATRFAPDFDKLEQVVLTLAAETSAMPEVSTPEARPNVKIDIGEQPKSTATPSGVKRIAAKPASSAQKPLRPAWQYRPAAPAGWVEVMPNQSPWLRDPTKPATSADDMMRQTMKYVAHNYPGRLAALEKHPRYKNVRQYFEGLHMQMSLPGRKRMNSGRVMYIHPDGSHLYVDVIFLSEQGRLGAPDAPDTWGDEIVARLSAQTFTKGVPTAYLSYRGAVAKMNTTDLTQITYPTSGAEPTSFSMDLAINNRTILKFTGLLSPDAMRGFVENINPHSFAERVADMG